jgi:serine/threonine-protein kinase
VPEGTIREGATITLVISRGPEPIQVPTNIIGKSWTEAKPILEATGLKLEYNGFADTPGASNFFRVATLDPGEGEFVLPGEPLRIGFTA